MIITIRYNQVRLLRGIVFFRPFLEVIEKYPFPPPVNCSRTNAQLVWVNTKINAFTSKKFLKYLEPTTRNRSIAHLTADDNSIAHLNVFISQGSDGSVLLLKNLLTFVDYPQSKQLFIDLLGFGQLLDHGWSLPVQYMGKMVARL
jgi:hypothetical protein